MGCVIDHASDRDPTHHPRWGLVPALTSTIIGGLVFGVLVVASAVWLPLFATVVLVSVAMGAAGISAIAQAVLGHRGRCWAERTIRWWLGPLGSLIDPFDAG